MNDPNSREIQLLVVEDQDEEFVILEDLLNSEESGIQIKRVVDAESALIELISAKYDAVLLDSTLPEGVGADTILRLQSAVEAVPVIALTEEDAEGIAALRAGALDGVPREGLRRGELLRAIYYGLERHRLLTELRSAQARAEQLAARDELSKLPNRAWFLQYLPTAIAAAERRESGLAVCFIDLDGFKEINDTYGHAVGDKLLTQVAQRLSGVTRRSDALVRLSGDEFVATLGGAKRSEDATKYAELALEALRQPFRVHEESLRISASIGIALFPDHATSPERLLHTADLAMYEAKKAGKNRWALSNNSAESSGDEMLEARHSIRQAVHSDELFLAFQPQVDLASKTMVGAEALVRWRHPSRGFVKPHDLIPMADRAGVLQEVGSWVFREVAKAMDGWSRSGQSHTVSINVSEIELADDGFADNLRWLSDELGALAKNIVLEVADSRHASYADVARKNLELSSELGFRIAIDGFDLGASSFFLLRQHAIDTLKIDRSLVSAIPSDLATRAIVKGIVSVASEMGIGTVGMGVERESEASALASLGCRKIQGFLVSQPLSADALTRWATSAPIADLLVDV